MVNLESYTIRVDSQGRIPIPRHLRKQAGVEAGAEVLVFVENGGLTILSRDAARELARRMAAEALKGCPGGSLAGDLLAERRREAEREEKIGRKKSA